MLTPHRNYEEGEEMSFIQMKHGVHSYQYIENKVNKLCWGVFSFVPTC